MACGGEVKIDARVIELEEKFSFQEDTLQQLNDVVAKQGLQIMELALQLKNCKEQLEGLRECRLPRLFFVALRGRASIADTSERVAIRSMPVKKSVAVNV